MATGGPESAAALEQSASPADRLSGLRAGNAEVNNRLDGAGIEGRTKAQSALREAMDAERAALGVETRGSLGVDGMMQTAQQLNRRDGRGEPYGGFSQRATGNLWGDPRFNTVPRFGGAADRVDLRQLEETLRRSLSQERRGWPQSGKGLSGFTIWASHRL